MYGEVPHGPKRNHRVHPREILNTKFVALMQPLHQYEKSKRVEGIHPISKTEIFDPEGTYNIPVSG